MSDPERSHVTMAPPEASSVGHFRFPANGSHLGALMTAHDWSASPLGAPDTWPQSLRSVVGLMLGARYPMFVAWGPELALLYNDGYAPILGARHPRALGLRLAHVWADIWPDIEPLVLKALAGEATLHEDLHLLMERNGYPEDTWYSFSYSPVHDESGHVAGMFCVCTETTERVLADRRRAEVQERQRQMLLQMPGFVGMLSGPDLVYTYVNDAYAAISERTDFVGRRFRDVFADIAGQGFHELFESVFHTGEGVVTRGMELRLHGREDTQYVDFVLEPIRDDHGVVTGVFVGGYETTEVYRASEALRVSEARLRELNADLERQANELARERGRTWEVSTDLLAVATPDGMFQSVNPAWTRTLGWPAEHVIATPLFAFVHPDDAAPTGDALERLRQGDPVLRFENRYAHADGGWRWLSWVAVPVEDRFYCSARDVTAEKEAEAERDRLWTLSEDMLARADYGGRLSAVNPAWTQVLGWSEHELLTNTYADIIHPDDLPATVAALRSMGETGQPGRFENCIRTKTGEWKPIGWTVSPEPDKVNFIAIGRDLSDYKARERELEQAQEALRQSQKMEAVGQLTGGIAHDFNNMLAVVIGSLDLLGRRLGTGDARARRYVDAATDGARRAALLTQRLLAFSRQQPLRPEPIDVNKLVTGISDLIRGSLGSDIRLETVLVAGGWRVHADPNQLENVLLNLAVNARDAMPEGGRLTIETQNAHMDARYAAANIGVPAGQYVLLAVTDTGSGMAQDVIAKAFDPFFTTKEVGKGTGLGLSQVYGFVKQSGGHVKIYSEPGQGTTVKVYLPRLIGAEEDGADENVSFGTPLGEGQEVILVVEDEPAVRQFSVDALTELGYRVIEAEGAATALRLLALNPEIALLFTDVVMPDMNGRKLADEVMTRRPDLKVLFTTGYTRNAVVHNGVLDPGVELIGKPFTVEELAAKVREVLDAPAARSGR